MVQQLVPPLFLHRLNVQWMGLSQNVTPTKHIEGTCRTMKRITVPFIYRFAGVIWLVNCGGGCCWLTVIETRNMTSALCLYTQTASRLRRWGNRFRLPRALLSFALFYLSFNFYRTVNLTPIIVQQSILIFEQPNG